METILKRKIVVVSGVIILLILTAIVTIRFYGNRKLDEAIMRFGREAGQTEIETYAPRRVAATRNAAVWISAAVGALIVTPEETKAIHQILEVPYEKWDAAKIQLLKEIWKRNDPTLQILDRTLEMEESNYDLDYSAGAEMNIDGMNLGSMIELRRLLTLKGRMHIGNGETAEALHVASILERMAASLNHESVLICALVGATIERDYYELLQSILPQSDEQMLHQIEMQLQHLKSTANQPSKVVAAEGAGFYRTLLYKPPSFLSDDPDPDAGLRFMLLMHRFNKPVQIAMVLDLYREQAQIAQRPVANFENERGTTDDSFTRSLLKGILLNFPTAIRRLQAIESSRVLAELALQLTKWGKANGSYPADLSRFSATVSPYTGETVQYARNLDGTAIISFPKAEESWPHVEKEPGPRKPLLRWNLPAPAKTK